MGKPQQGRCRSRGSSFRWKGINLTLHIPWCINVLCSREPNLWLYHCSDGHWTSSVPCVQQNPLRCTLLCLAPGGCHNLISANFVQKRHLLQFTHSASFFCKAGISHYNMVLDFSLFSLWNASSQKNQLYTGSSAFGHSHFKPRWILLICVHTNTVSSGTCPIQPSVGHQGNRSHTGPSEVFCHFVKLSRNISKHIHYPKFHNGPEKYFALLSDFPFHFSGLSHFSADVGTRSAAWCYHSTPVTVKQLWCEWAGCKYEIFSSLWRYQCNQAQHWACCLERPTATDPGGSGLVSAIPTSDVSTVLPGT